MEKIFQFIRPIREVGGAIWDNQAKTALNIFDFAEIFLILSFLEFLAFLEFFGLKDIFNILIRCNPGFKYIFVNCVRKLVFK